MNSKTTLEFDKILEMLSEYALTDKARERISELSPFLREKDVLSNCEDTTEARIILDTVGNPPITAMKNTEKYLETASKGGMLDPKELTEFGQFLSSCRRLKSFLKKAEITDTKIAYYGNTIDSLERLFDEIDRCIRNEQVDSSASNLLRDIRRKKENTNSQIKLKLDTILKSKKEYFSDSFVSNRNGHFTLPVKKEYKNQVSGSVIDISATGVTYFIEPSAIAKYREELSVLEISEQREIEKILYSIASCIDDFKTEIKLNIDAIQGDTDESIQIKASEDRIIRKTEYKKTVQSHAEKFSLGDSVIVYPEKKLGIICQTSNAKGELGVMIQKKKRLVNHKRIKLKTPAAELYPADYDFSVIFDSVENRKARHKLEKGHHPDVIVYIEDELQ